MESTAYTISFYAFAAATMLSILIGSLYVMRRQIMPYHLEALETTWDEIEAKYQFMMLKFLNGAGFFGLSSGLFMLILLWIPFQEGQLWAGYAIGAIGLVGTLPLAYIVYQVKTKTKGNPPLGLVVVLNLLLVIGLVGCFISR